MGRAPYNYHPEVMDTVRIEVPKNYHPLCYQTKAYDEYTKSLSTFTQDEWDFMEQYRLLHQVSEFFKPEDLFCVMKNDEAERTAEQIFETSSLTLKGFAVQIPPYCAQ